MPDYQPSTYGDRIADAYDELIPAQVAATTDASVDFLASVAKRPRALELGIGTGRIAIPLRERGFEVSGIDASPAMVKKLRAKKGGAEIPVEVGDFADVKVRAKFPLIYVAFNTFFALLTQDAQLRCFERVARRLTSDGVFVISAFVPDLARFDRGQRVGTTSVDLEVVSLEATQHDPVAADPDVRPRGNQRTRHQAVSCQITLRVSFGAGSDGATRRNASARAVRRMVPRTV